MNIQWYPGHMTKAVRMMQENIRLIDLVIELVDARVPLSSKNPDMDELAKNKYRLILLNKSDLADDRLTAAWEAYYQERGFAVRKINARSGAGMKALQDVIQEVCREKLERDRKRGIKNRPIRAMIVGIPNVGKSTFINSYVGKACTKTGNQPGVTKGAQWIRIHHNVELLDTPGILWPKFEDQEVGLRLAYIGSIRDTILDTQELAACFLKFMTSQYPGKLAAYYDVKEDQEPWEILEQIAVRLQCWQKGGQPDCEKAAVRVLDAYRAGKLGRMTLEQPPQTENEAEG